MPDDDPYTTEPTHLRVFTDGSGEWFIDGADDHGRYTEECWSYPSQPEALAAAPEFVAIVRATWCWTPGRRGVINPAVTA